MNLSRALSGVSKSFAKRREFWPNCESENTTKSPVLKGRRRLSRQRSVRCGACAILFSATSFDGRSRCRVNSAWSAIHVSKARPLRPNGKRTGRVNSSSAFLPEPLTEEEIKPAIRTAIRESVQQGCKILGRYRKNDAKAQRPNYGKRVNQSAREVLLGPCCVGASV
jgi:hypothetical protein